MTNYSNKHDEHFYEYKIRYLENDSFRHLYLDTVTDAIDIGPEDVSSKEAWYLGVGNKLRAIQNEPLIEESDLNDPSSNWGMNMNMELQYAIYSILNDAVFRDAKVRIYPSPYRHVSRVDRAHIFFSEPYASGSLEFESHHDAHNEKTLGISSPLIQKLRSPRDTHVFDTDAYDHAGARMCPPPLFSGYTWPHAKKVVSKARNVLHPYTFKDVIANTFYRARAKANSVSFELGSKENTALREFRQDEYWAEAVKDIRYVEGKPYVVLSDELHSKAMNYLNIVEDNKHIRSDQHYTVVFIEKPTDGDAFYNIASVTSSGFREILVGDLRDGGIQLRNDLPDDIGDKLCTIQMHNEVGEFVLEGVGYQLNPNLFYLYV